MSADLCGLCGRPALGFAGYSQHAGAEFIRLCHQEERDCYRRWTVYGERPCWRCMGRGFHKESAHALACYQTCEMCGGSGRLAGDAA